MTESTALQTGIIAGVLFSFIIGLIVILIVTLKTKPKENYILIGFQFGVGFILAQLIFSLFCFLAIVLISFLQISAVIQSDPLFPFLFR